MAQMYLKPETTNSLINLSDNAQAHSLCIEKEMGKKEASHSFSHKCHL